MIIRTLRWYCLGNKWSQLSYCIGFLDKVCLVCRLVKVLYLLREVGRHSRLPHCQGQFITMTSWWPRWRLKSPASRLFTQPFIQTQIKENNKAPPHWPLWVEFTGDRWIPRTKGQLCFHLMTSSCDIVGILPKRPYLPCVSMAGRALLAGYHRYTMWCWYNAIDILTQFL